MEATPKADSSKEEKESDANKNQEDSGTEEEAKEEEGQQGQKQEELPKEAGEKKVILHGLDVQIPKGSLVAVVGRVGAGKSTLLSSILGETEK